MRQLRPRPELRTRRWAAFRRSILVRDGYRCRTCGRPGRLEVNHIVPVHLGGATFDPENAQALCRADHIAKTADENRERQHGRPPVDRTGWREYIKELIA